MTGESEAPFQRLDKWLVFTRFCKTRSVAATLVASGRLRLEGSIVTKPDRKLRIGEVLTFPQGDYVRVVKVLALPERRGPASQAQACYEDLRPIAEQEPIPKPSRLLSSGREPGSGRPTKRDRRETDKLRGD